MRRVVPPSHYFIVNPLQISVLSDRIGAAVVAFFSCSNLEDTFELNWICSGVCKCCKLLSGGNELQNVGYLPALGAVGIVRATAESDLADF